MCVKRIFCERILTISDILTKLFSLHVLHHFVATQFLNVSGGSNLVRRGSCDSSSDSEHVSGGGGGHLGEAETYVSFTGGPHKHSNPDIVKGVS